MSIFYGTEIEIWAGFRPIGCIEEKNWVDYVQLLGQFFNVFMGKKIFKNIVVSALKSCIISLLQKKNYEFCFGLK